MLQVRDAVREVFRTQLAEAPEETITEARRHLNRSYDLFVFRFGPLNAAPYVTTVFALGIDISYLHKGKFDPATLTGGMR